MNPDRSSSFILGGLIALGLACAAWLLGSSAIRFKEYERVVSVKGLAEREVPADIAVWPIRFVGADNDVTTLYAAMEKRAGEVAAFLKAEGFATEEVTVAAPAVSDRYAESGARDASLRYAAQQTVTVYSGKVDAVRKAQARIAELGKKGIAFGGEDYGQRTEYLYTKLNEIKPAMIEEATQKARAVAEKFAADSKSRLGKLKSANQGQFTIEDRDSNTPYLKKVRVVSTVDYYLSD